MTPRCYRVADILRLLQMSSATFYRLRADLERKGVLEELRPRLGHVARYRADRIDAYLANQTTAPRAFALARRR